MARSNEKSESRAAVLSPFLPGVPADLVRAALTAAGGNEINSGNDRVIHLFDELLHELFGRDQV